MKLLIATMLALTFSCADSVGESSLQATTSLYYFDHTEIAIRSQGGVDHNLKAAIAQAKLDWNALDTPINFASKGGGDGEYIQMATTIIESKGLGSVVYSVDPSPVVVAAHLRWYGQNTATGVQLADLSANAVQHIACRMLGQAVGLTTLSPEPDSCMDSCSNDTDMTCLDDPAKTTPGAQDEALLQSVYY